MLEKLSYSLSLPNLLHSEVAGRMKRKPVTVLTVFPSSGQIDIKTTNEADGLIGLLNKPPTIQRDLQPLSSEQFSGFRLKPGKLEDRRNPLFTGHKKKKKKRDGDSEGMSLRVCLWEYGWESGQ